MQAILCSAGRERRDVVYDRLGPKYGGGAALPASKHPTASDRTTRSTRGKKDGKRKSARSVRDRQAQYGDDQILSLRVGAIEIMDAITDRNDAQKELTAEIERAALEALLATAVQVYPPPQDEWHAPARAERRKKRNGEARASPGDLAEACLKMRIDVTCTLAHSDEKLAGECKSVAWCKSYMQQKGKRRGGKHIWQFGTTADFIAAKAGAF